MSIMDLFNKRSKPQYIISYPTSPNSHRDYILRNNPVALYCADLVASSVASMPLDLYRRGEGKVKASEHYLSSLIKNPNFDESYTLFIYSLVQDYYSGNIYLYQYRDEEGKIVSIYRLPPEQVTVKRDANNRKIYTYTSDSTVKTYTSDNIIHIPSRYGYDGLKGVSIYEYGKNAFNQAQSLDEYTDNYFTNSLGSGKRLQIDISKAMEMPNLTKEQLDSINARLVQPYSGKENAGKPIIKSMPGVEYSSIDLGSMNNQAAQLIENRDYITQSICSLFGVPLSFLKGENKYNSVEVLYQILLDTSVRPICLAIQEGLSRLLNPYERNYLYFEFNYNSLKRLDMNSKIDAYTKQLGSGILSVNEVRSKENLSPIEAGNYNFIQANLMPLTESVVNAYMASAKLKMEQMISKDSSGVGDDKK